MGDARDLETIADSELARYFLKPCDSQAFSARFGLKGFPIADRRHANVSIERATREGLSLLAQEMIPGPTTNHVFLDGYVAREGTFAALLARRRLRMFPLDFGNSTMTLSIPLSEAEGAVDSLCSRSTPELGGRSGSGPVAGSPCLAYRDALGEPVEPVTAYEVARRWVHEFRDPRAWLGERGRRLNPLVSWRGCEYAIFSRDDRKPFVLAARRDALLARLRELV
ncbi:MAG: hypothetical protein AUH17_02770 [Actinobacteria bacterium 13_2_20CM_68_14]|nr:MAG: hypothetical protein AUH17_02770 [Actinobacteria bacterium 13_2_20CM_68_14]